MLASYNISASSSSLSMLLLILTPSPSPSWPCPDSSATSCPTPPTGSNTLGVDTPLSVVLVPLSVALVLPTTACMYADGTADVAGAAACPVRAVAGAADGDDDDTCCANAVGCDDGGATLEIVSFGWAAAGEVSGEWDPKQVANSEDVREEEVGVRKD
mmetsp:Transcript_49861/g.124430  ORF Transcript_49861/g.124430 Transcript_49861/m.124430 type:complete len:158 (+) Transcript_49861:237-710(+)